MITNLTIPSIFNYATNTQQSNTTTSQHKLNDSECLKKYKHTLPPYIKMTYRQESLTNNISTICAQALEKASITINVSYDTLANWNRDKGGYTAYKQAFAIEQQSGELVGNIVDTETNKGRREAEHILFNIDPNDDTAARPIYGALNIRNQVNGAMPNASYGNSAFVIKKNSSIKKTFTLEDSMNAVSNSQSGILPSDAPVAVSGNELRELVFQDPTGTLLNYLKTCTETTHPLSAKNIPSFSPTDMHIECQLHVDGHLKFFEHLEKVIIHSDEVPGETIDSKVSDVLKTMVRFDTKRNQNMQIHKVGWFLYDVSRQELINVRARQASQTYVIFGTDTSPVKTELN